MRKSDLKFWVALSCNPKIGAKTFQKLYQNFDSLEDVWKAEVSDFQKKKLPDQLFQLVAETRQKINPAEELQKLEKLQIRALPFFDKDYPRLLKEIPDPPGLLYVKGNLDLIEPAISVVGSRKVSAYGKQVTAEIVEPLALEGLTIVSGLALGVDSLSHQAAVNCGGKTIAVLGSGLDKIYPTNNLPLADKILQKGGAIISEFPLGTLPYKSHFPLRNRIIAGLSQGTLVIEAALHSGALITAAAALDYNRLVFAVPGSIYNENCAGTNNLIKMGAKPVTSAFDIFEELNIQVKKKGPSKKIFESKEEEILAKFLKSEPVHVDKLAQMSKLDIATVNSTLTLMEIKGYVKNMGAGMYVVRE